MNSSCNNFLEVKPDVKLSTPETLTDIRALLDHEESINRNYLGLIEMAVDDYFMTSSVWSSRTVFDRDIYVWKPEPYFTPANLGSQWNNTYSTIAITNIALEGLARNNLENTQEGRVLKGEALFVRAFNFLILTQTYAAHYDSKGSNPGLGIPLRVHSSLNQITTRASLTDTYDRIINDLTTAVSLLPVRSLYLTRPSRGVAQAILSRLYLYMGDYAKALHYAEEVLTIHSELLDYNTIDPRPLNPFSISNNPELIYFAVSASGSSLMSARRTNVDTILYRSYDKDDIRKQVFFAARGDGYHSFKGFYNGHEATYFVAPAIDEVYLIKSECLIRENKIPEGLQALNYLLLHRYKTGSFQPYPLMSKEAAMRLVLSERRKQLIRRGVRWTDLKRLNKEPELAKTLMRKMIIDGQEEIITLPPNDLRYVHLFPQEIVELTGILQNPR